MSESFRASSGRKVMSRESATEVGFVGHLLVDAAQRRVVAVAVGRGKKARLVDWDQLSGFGPDAVMVVEEKSLRSPVDEHERAALEGNLDLVGKRVLTNLGYELGKIDDVTFDPGSGMLEELLIGARRVPAGSLMGNGSYAAVLDESLVPPP